ncbi:MAG: pyocin knob domain-containing protein [Bacteroides uniformis]
MAEQDIKMNSFSQATDAAYIYAEAANGSQVKIKKSDLLSSLFQGRGDVTSNLDDYTTTGFYGINAALYVTGVVSYGMLLVFSGVNVAEAARGNPIVQIAINGYHPAVAMKVRVRWQSTWSEWKSITLT